VKKTNMLVEIARVVDRGNCSGCGTCALLNPATKMTLSEDGYMRPVTQDGHESNTDTNLLRTFAEACPGRRVDAQRPETSTRHPILGPITSIWEAYAIDPEIRFKGSSGGTITALSTWLLETDRVAQVHAAQPDDSDPRRTEAVRVTDSKDTLRTAGSRYAPVSVTPTVDIDSSTSAVVAKPCEISALRKLTQLRGIDGPILLSFFCAGVPSQHATDDLVERLGIPSDQELESLRYRGHGWPGEFTAQDTEGNVARTSYDVSWGSHLGPAIQSRCKICPDGVGESADITAGDYWRADERGYPDFANAEGVSVLIARTARGETLLREAAAAGVISIRSIDPDSVAAIQPSQSVRRRTLSGRLLGGRVAGHLPPRYRGFGLLGLSARAPVKSVRAAVGTYIRARRWQR
jgi:coenzyme F420 hydrogenase subunit beta